MKIVDLSRAIERDMPVFPGDETPRLSLLKSPERDGYTAYLLRTGLHAGTHVDFPQHMIAGGKSCIDFPADRFFGAGVLLDARGERVITQKSISGRDMLENKIVLIRTGFDQKWGTPEYFTAHPVLSEELAEYFVKSRVKMVGIDAPSPDLPPYNVHRILLSAGVLIVENLTGLGSIPEGADFEVMAAPPRIAAEASPVRVLCRVAD